MRHWVVLTVQSVPWRWMNRLFMLMILKKRCSKRRISHPSITAKLISLILIQKTIVGVAKKRTRALSVGAMPVSFVAGAKLAYSFIFAALLLCASNLNAQVPPVEIFRQQYPALYKLYLDNSRYARPLADYATRQGFRQPYENVGTVLHEMIHIASAAHDGFFIDGIYYEPYLHRGAWPSLSNADIDKYLTQQERTIISAIYLPNTPNNNLGNVLDEINAYSHVAQFICENEPLSAEKQVRNLLGHLQLQEAYLRVVRTTSPAEYRQLAANRQSRGAVVTLNARAVQALRACGVAEKKIPALELGYLLGLGESK